MEKSWASLLMSIIFAALLYAFYRFKIAQLRKELEFQRKEAEDKQLVAEPEITILRDQLHSIFIFECLNSIHNYIVTSDAKTAGKSLNKFASLMRSILANTSKPFIPIYYEVEFLELYMQTEVMLLGKKFTYSININDQVNKYEIVVPTMIFQPFVESAINHGLKVKKEGGHIKIEIKKDEHKLICIVEDNGIGRVRSKLLNKSNIHKSKPFPVTSRRLELLYKKDNISQFQIIGLYDDDDNPSGTKVEIYLPYKTIQ